MSETKSGLVFFRRQYILQYREALTGQWLDADYYTSEWLLLSNVADRRVIDPEVEWRAIARTTSDTEIQP